MLQRLVLIALYSTLQIWSDKTPIIKCLGYLQGLYVGQQKATGIRHGNCEQEAQNWEHTACSRVIPQSKGTALLLICTNKANCTWSIRKGTVRSAGDNSTRSTMWEPPGTELVPGILVYCQLQLPRCAGETGPLMVGGPV